MTTSQTSGPRAVTLVHGGQIGDALSSAVKRCIAAAGVELAWEDVDAGVRSVDKGLSAMPDTVVASIKRTGVGLKVLLRTPVGAGYESPNVMLRKQLGVFAGVRPLRQLRGIHSRYPAFDILLVREMTEGTYAGIEHEIVPGVVESIKVMTAEKCERLLEYGFRLCKERGRKRLTLVHKANIMKMSDGMLTRIGRRIAEQHPEVEYKEIIVDNCAMQLVARPEQFDVLVADNMFGDILADIGAGLAGSSVLVPSINVSPDAYVFEATHWVGLEARADGEIVANPLALLIPALEMLDHLDFRDAAARLRTATSQVLIAGQHVTPDLGGTASTKAMADAIIAALGA
jgi:isocitrate dehydrogenase (NAD+)